MKHLKHNIKNLLYHVFEHSHYEMNDNKINTRRRQGFVAISRQLFIQPTSEIV